MANALARRLRLRRRRDGVRAMARLCHVAGNAGLPDVINATGMIRTMEQVMVDLITDDPAFLRYVERKSMILLEVTRRTWRRVGAALTCCGWARIWERNGVR